MNFEAPVFFAALGILLPVALAFLFRRRRRVVRVPSTLLWRRVAVARVRNRRIRSLARVLAFLACVAGVWALVLAAARPTGAAAGQTLALVVDVSASMGGDEGETPFARAHAHITELLATRGLGDEVLLIAAGPRPTRLAGPTADGAVLARGLAHLEPGLGASDHAAAVALAAALLDGAPDARIELLHDGGWVEGGDVREPAAIGLVERIFGDERRVNVGITAFASRAPEDAVSDDDRAVLVAVANAGFAQREVRVALTAEGVPLAERRVEVPAKGEVDVTFRVRTPARSLRAAVAPADGGDDALRADDHAELALGRSVPPRVHLLMARESMDGEHDARGFFAEQALRAAGVVEIERGLTARPPAALGDQEIVVVVGDAPVVAADAPTLFLASAAGSLPVEVLGSLDADRGETRLRSVDASHALTRGVELDGVAIGAATAVGVPEGARALVELDGGTVVAAGGAGRSAWAYVGVDPSRSDIVLRVAYPVLVANALAVLGGASHVQSARTLPRAEILLRAPAEDATELAAAAPAPLRLPASPPVLLALFAAALLALEGAAWWKGYVR